MHHLQKSGICRHLGSPRGGPVSFGKFLLLLPEKNLFNQCMDKKYPLILIAILVILILGLAIMSQKKSSNPPAKNPTTSTTAEKNPIENANYKYFYPINNYEGRLTVRWFGKYVSASEKPPTCGRTFVGFHDADDLEIFKGEVNETVPVYAIADSKLIEFSEVAGYGGLLVLEANINGQKYTLNYGHIKLSSVRFQKGDDVPAGAQVAELGQGCSAETDGERKHLHFAIHKGDGVDVRGYLNSEQELASWENPKEFLQNLQAVNKK